MAAKIILVEPDQEQREQFLATLRGSSFEVCNIVDTNAEAVEIFDSVRPHLLVLRVVSGKLGAGAALERIKKKNRNVKAVVSYDVGSTHLLMKAYSQGAIAAIKQPFGMRKVIDKLTYAIASERYEKLGGPIVRLEHAVQVRCRKMGFLSRSRVGFCERLGMTDMDLNVDKPLQLYSVVRVEIIMPQPPGTMKFFARVEDVVQTRPDSSCCFLSLKDVSSEQRKKIEGFLIQAAKKF